MIALNNRVTVLSVRVAQASFAIIVLALTADVANWWTGYWHADSPSSINFLLFDAVWTLLALAYLIVIPWAFSQTIAAHQYAILGVECVTTIFWFAGFIALASALHDRSCTGGICSAAQAAASFGAFEWVLFSVTAAMAAWYAYGGGRNGGTSGAVDKDEMAGGPREDGDRREQQQQEV